MPRYHVTLKAGRNTPTLHIEAKSLSNCLAFCRAVFYAEVVEVKEVVYFNESLVIPVDDINAYYGVTKVIARSADNYSSQFIFHYVKKTISMSELSNYVKANLEVANKNIDSIVNITQKQKSY